MRRVLLALWFVAGTVLTLAPLWATDIPLGIPGEWEWSRLPVDSDAGLNLLLALGAAALYVVVVAVGGMRLLTSSVMHVETGVWLIVLTVAAFGWLWCVQETAPVAGTLGKGPFVLYYPGASGYFAHVRYEAPELPQFLAEYEPFMRQGDFLHIGTHPPGLFCLFYGLNALVEHVPDVAVVDQWQPDSVRDAFNVIASNSSLTARPLAPRDRTVLWLAILLSQALAAATVIPLYGLFRATYSRTAAFAAAALWPSVPAVAIFVPKSDAAFPALAALIVWLVVSAWRKPCVVLGFLAGLMAWCGLFFSLAFLPVLAFSASWCAVDVVNAFRARSASKGEFDGSNSPLLALRARIAVIVAAVAGFAIPIVALWATTGMNLLVVWSLNLHNHASFYSQSQRTYLLWLAENPLELAIAVGWPLMAAAVVSLTRTIGGGLLLTVCPASPTDFVGSARAAILGVAMWAVLWLTGKNSGEAARLWLLCMPGIVWLAAYFPQPEPAGHLSDGRGPLYRQIAFLSATMLVCIATVHRVCGFHV